LSQDIALVERFVAAWNALDWDAIFAALHPEIVYHNIPWARVEGIAAVRENLLGFGIEAAEWTIHAIAAAGSTVLTERTDRVSMGGRWIALRVMGVFEIEDGLIRAWRDYFDPAELAPAA
jgi:limonene-1,2-epoxide hydrolase